MTNEKQKGNTAPETSSLTVKEAEKPDLVKKIGGTTFDVHVHFSETSKETFTDKVIRLIHNENDSTAK